MTKISFRWSWEKNKEEINALRQQRLQFLKRKWAKEASWQLMMFSFIHDIFDSAQAEYPVICDGNIFFLDVAIPEKGIAFEYDGQDFHQDTQHEKWRDRLLKKAGWKVYHFSSRNFNTLFDVLGKID